MMRIIRCLGPAPVDPEKFCEPIIFPEMMSSFSPNRWDMLYLQSVLGDTEVSVIDQGGPNVVWDPETRLGSQKWPFTKFHWEIHSRWCYLQENIANLPKLWRDTPHLTIPFKTRKPIERVKLWVSGRELTTPLHYDPCETLHWVVKGSKRFTMYPPGLRGMSAYPADSKASFVSRRDVDVDPPNRPEYQFVLNAGEVLYLPAYWWHQVTSLGLYNVSLNYVWLNSWRTNARCFSQYWRSRKHLKKQLAAARAAKGTK